uniref:Cyclin-dependent kinase inhibitor domain-containing protein n=2 Tax=Pygocentrus nattereri TaxID=42514 RepID=A0AAR2LHM6_PYGNA
MANVEVQSVLERHAARRTFPLLARTKACRNLFGPVDHEELNREMKQKLQEISDGERSRWNFNFEQDSPLPGNYEWEEVSARCLPAFYMDSVRCGARARTALPLLDNKVECEGKSEEQARERPAGEVNQENQSGALNGTSACARRRRRTGSVPDSPRNNSTQITDFFPRRKRPAERKPESPSLPVEVTPRKRIRW